jgi:hypothetical protein
VCDALRTMMNENRVRQARQAPIQAAVRSEQSHNSLRLSFTWRLDLSRMQENRERIYLRKKGKGTPPNRTQ